MCSRRHSLLPAALAALAVGPLRAQVPEPLITDRPDQTESASVIPAGYVQVEFGTTYTHDDDSGVRARSLAVPVTLVRIGVGQRLEARGGFGGWLRNERGAAGSTSTESGVGDVAFGFKYRVRDGERLRPSVALVTTVTLPTANEGFGNEHLQPTVLLAATHQLGSRVGLGYNLGTAWTTVSGPSGNETSVDMPYTAVVGTELAARVAVFAEAFGALPLSGRGSARHAVDAGVTMLLRTNLQLDLSGGLGLDADAADWFVGAGASLRLPR